MKIWSFVVSLFLMGSVAFASEVPTCQLSPEGELEFQLPLKEGSLYSLQLHSLNIPELEKEIVIQADLEDLEIQHDEEVAEESAEMAKPPGAFRRFGDFLKRKITKGLPVSNSPSSSIPQESPVDKVQGYEVNPTDLNIAFIEDGRVYELPSSEASIKFTPIVYKLFVKHFDNILRIDKTNEASERRFLFGSFEYTGSLKPETYVYHGKVFGCEIDFRP